MPPDDDGFLGLGLVPGRLRLTGLDDESLLAVEDATQRALDAVQRLPTGELGRVVSDAKGTMLEVNRAVSGGPDGLARKINRDLDRVQDETVPRINDLEIKLRERLNEVRDEIAERGLP